MFLTNFAPRHSIDDYKLGDVNVSLLTVLLRCVFVFLRIFLDSEAVLWLAHLCLEIFYTEINTTPDEMESFFLLVLVSSNWFLDAQNLLCSAPRFIHVCATRPFRSQNSSQRCSNKAVRPLVMAALSSNAFVMIPVRCFTGPSSS